MDEIEFRYLNSIFEITLFIRGGNSGIFLDAFENIKASFPDSSIETILIQDIGFMPKTQSNSIKSYFL
jgi:hypothetical protein